MTAKKNILPLPWCKEHKLLRYLPKMKAMIPKKPIGFQLYCYPPKASLHFTSSLLEKSVSVMSSDKPPCILPFKQQSCLTGHMSYFDSSREWVAACSVGWFISLLVREEVLLVGLCERKILSRLKIYDHLRQATAKRTDVFSKKTQIALLTS